MVTVDVTINGVTLRVREGGVLVEVPVTVKVIDAVAVGVVRTSGARERVMKPIQ